MVKAKSPMLASGNQPTNPKIEKKKVSQSEHSDDQLAEDVVEGRNSVAQYDTQTKLINSITPSPS